MNALLAVPSTAPGGFTSPVSVHFGHCDAFTLIALRDGNIEKTSILPTPTISTAAAWCRSIFWQNRV